VTFPSPQLTASTFPARLHETRHTTSGNLPGVAPAPGAALTDGSSGVLTHGAVGVSFVHTSTVLSCQPITSEASKQASRRQRNATHIHMLLTEREKDAYLRCSCDVRTWQPDIRRPRDVAHPISVTLQHVLLHPGLRLLGEPPDLDDIVTPCAGKPFYGRGAGGPARAGHCQQ